MKTPRTYKKESPPTTDDSMPRPPRSIQQYLNNLTNPAMPDSLHSSTDTLVNPDTPTQPLDTIRQEDLSTIPLSLQLAFAPQSRTPITTECPNTIAPQLQYPNLSTYRSPQLHPCGLAHDGPCPVPINSRLDYDAVKDVITELDIQTQAQAPPQTGPHSYHHVHPRTPYGGLTMEELESDISRLYSIMQRLIHTIEVEEEQYQMAQDRIQRMAAERDQHTQRNKED